MLEHAISSQRPNLINEEQSLFSEIKNTLFPFNNKLKIRFKRKNMFRKAIFH